MRQHAGATWGSDRTSRTAMSVGTATHIQSIITALRLQWLLVFHGITVCHKVFTLMLRLYHIIPEAFLLSFFFSILYLLSIELLARCPYCPLCLYARKDEKKLWCDHSANILSVPGHMVYTNKTFLRFYFHFLPRRITMIIMLPSEEHCGTIL